MKYIKQILSATLTAVLAWGVLIVADAIDEYILDTDFYLGIIIYFLLPVVMLICYIIYNIKHKPTKTKLFVWHMTYSIICGIIWYVVYCFAEKDMYFIRQENRSSWLNLNGIEYIFFGFSIILAFTLLCLIFHFISFIIRLVKHNKV